MIKGDFAEAQFQISAPQHKVFEGRFYYHSNYVKIPYKKGENCIVFLAKHNRILYGIEYVFSGIYMCLDANNQIDVVQVENDILDVDFKTIGELKTHLQQYIPLDVPGPVTGWPYTTSDKLEDAVQVAYSVYRIKPIEKLTPFEDKVYYKYLILEVLKGLRPYHGNTLFTTVWYNAQMETGKEYIVLTDMAFTAFVSKAHGVIPMEDTQRVNTVYELLGVQH